jgi:DNA processing protein
MSHAWIALNAVNGLGAVRFSKLLERFGSPEAVFTIPSEQLIQEGLLSPAIAAELHDPALQENARRQQLKAEQMGVRVLTLKDKEYPSYLREIYAPPPVLFVRGNLSAFSYHAVAIVGSRSPTLYGKQATALITRELIQHKFVVVSGLARGIDTVAHETALEHGGSTIAVLGCGIDTIYPRINSVLAEKICTTGLLVSEFPIETAPEAFNFPRRNRIISGCSAAVVVVEAGEKSGSLITARYALQQGREVCAVPGPITSPLSRGTFNLIKEGATPVRSGHELAESLKVITLSENTLAQKSHDELTESIFTEEERHVYNALSDEPMRIDAIADAQCKPITDLFVVLLNLELKGLVQQCSGQQFMRIAR